MKERVINIMLFTEEEVLVIEELWSRYPEFEELRAFQKHFILKIDGLEGLYVGSKTPRGYEITCPASPEDLIRQLRVGYLENDFC